MCARTKQEAKEYYNMVYDNGLYTKENLYEIYNEAKCHKADWERYSKTSEAAKRDYESYCNSQKALEEIFADRFDDARFMSYDEYQNWMCMMNID